MQSRFFVGLTVVVLGLNAVTNDCLSQESQTGSALLAKDNATAEQLSESEILNASVIDEGVKYLTGLLGLLRGVTNVRRGTSGPLYLMSPECYFLPPVVVPDGRTLPAFRTNQLRLEACAWLVLVCHAVVSESPAKKRRLRRMSATTKLRISTMLFSSTGPSASVHSGDAKPVCKALQMRSSLQFSITSPGGHCT